MTRLHSQNGSRFLRDKAQSHPCGRCGRSRPGLTSLRGRPGRYGIPGWFSAAPSEWPLPAMIVRPPRWLLDPPALGLSLFPAVRAASPCPPRW
jgi:hypothetical protein